MVYHWYIYVEYICIYTPPTSIESTHTDADELFPAKCVSQTTIKFSLAGAGRPTSDSAESWLLADPDVGSLDQRLVAGAARPVHASATLAAIGYVRIVSAERTRGNPCTRFAFRPRLGLLTNPPPAPHNPQPIDLHRTKFTKIQPWCVSLTALYNLNRTLHSRY